MSDRLTTQKVLVLSDKHLTPEDKKYLEETGKDHIWSAQHRYGWFIYCDDYGELPEWARHRLAEMRRKRRRQR